MYRIAIVGSGPRGLSVVERLAARLDAAPAAAQSLDIHLVDAVEIGCGRVWRTDQPDWFVMNSQADQVSSFSGPPDDGPARAGAGPSLAQWWQTVDPRCPGPSAWAPRVLHGRYMQYMLQTVEAGLPPGVRLHRTHAEVVDLEPFGQCYRLTFRNGTCLDADRVVITTGHTTPEPAGVQRTLADFAAHHPGLQYIGGDSPADMPLSSIPPRSHVGIIGLGLTFFDIMAALTVGRGGSFRPNDTNGLEYRSSGDEPVLVAGSRRGMPFLARPHAQGAGAYYYRPVLFTVDRVRGQGGKPIDFTADVWPWLYAEATHTYYGTAIGQRYGVGAAAAFTADVLQAAQSQPPDVTALAARHGITDLPPLAPDELSHPFTNRTYTNPAAFEHDLLAAVTADLKHAEQGSVDCPLKAAIGTMSSTHIRSVIRELVNFAGLTPASHRTDFLDWYVPLSAQLGTGPHRERLYELRALIASGHLRIVGPDARYEPAPAHGRFVVSSPQVQGSETAVETIIDAHIPRPDLHRDPAPLTAKLIARGILTSFVNGQGPDAFDTGGVHITPGSYHPIGRKGLPDTGLHVLGVPTEHTRWLTAVGSGRPRFWNEFMRDADAVAAVLLKPRS